VNGQAVTEPDVGAVLALRSRAARDRSRTARARSQTLVSACRLMREGDTMVTSCAWCTRLCVDGSWLRASDTSLFTATIAARTTHGICPDCLAALAEAGRTAPLAC
jgi:hypothetical protein